MDNEQPPRHLRNRQPTLRTCVEVRHFHLQCLNSIVSVSQVIAPISLLFAFRFHHGRNPYYRCPQDDEPFLANSVLDILLYMSFFGTPKFAYLVEARIRNSISMKQK